MQHKCVYCQRSVKSSLYKKHIKACNEASKHVSNKSCNICQKTFKKLSEIYVHILETHSQSLEVNVELPANEADTNQITNSTTVSQNFQTKKCHFETSHCLPLKRLTQSFLNFFQMYHSMAAQIPLKSHFEGKC